MKCADVEARLSAYLDAELSAELSSAVRGHLRACGGACGEHQPDDHDARALRHQDSGAKRAGSRPVNGVGSRAPK